jgi:predicted TIM-barrel fold metal-dependent hydrolase
MTVTQAAATAQPDTASGTPKLRQYHLISADSHVIEPPDLWTSRVPHQFRDRAPQQKRFEDGDAWIIEGTPYPQPFGLNACAGLSQDLVKPYLFWEQIRKGGYEPAARVAEQDRDHVDAEILYPSPRLLTAMAAVEDPEFHLALVQAYNDWISEFVEYAPDRFGGIAVLPNRGATQALAEIERVSDRPGIRGVVIGCFPNGSLQLSVDDDPVWRALGERRIPLGIHVSLSTTMAPPPTAVLPAARRFLAAPSQVLDFIFAGVFDRVQDLQVVLAEVDCGWVPYFKEQIDDGYRRHGQRNSWHGALGLPSEYVERHFTFAYVTDTYGVDNRHRIGVNRMLWSSDFPHASSDWPNSWRTVAAAFAGVAFEERHAILAGNSSRLYGF